MENVRNHRDIKLVTTKIEEVYCIRAKLSFEQTHFEIFNDNGNEKGRSKNESTDISRSSNIRY